MPRSIPKPSTEFDDEMMGASVVDNHDLQSMAFEGFAEAQGAGRTMPCGEAVGLLCKLTTSITYVLYNLLMEY